MNLPILSGDQSWFPPSSTALDEPNGLLAAGGDLSPQRLLNAYSRGIFPWFQDDQPILWWSPDPRMTLKPDEIHISKSMKKFLAKTSLSVKVDSCFDRVMDACSQDRKNSSGTWITQDMYEAYCYLHELGYCHSIEVFDAQKLVGGLYGVSLGQIFFGESMFSRLTNASKLALITLANFLRRHQFQLIDCQVASPHLSSLGAQEITREQFEVELSAGITQASLKETQALWSEVKQKTLKVDGHISD